MVKQNSIITQGKSSQSFQKHKNMQGKLNDVKMYFTCITK